MLTPHPLFLRLHAHLCGASELLRSGVSEQRLLSLYPTEFDTYRPFFTGFFEKHPEKLRNGRDDLVAIATSYKLLDAILEAVEKRISLGIYTDEQYDRQREIATEQIPPQVESLAAKITGSSESYAYDAVHHQLEFFARVMLLLSDWPAEEFDDDAALGVTTRHIFFEGFERLLAYYGVRIRFDTERRRIDAQWREEEALRAIEREARVQR